jgi:hypothetical protein
VVEEVHHVIPFYVLLRVREAIHHDFEQAFFHVGLRDVEEIFFYELFFEVHGDTDTVLRGYLVHSEDTGN